MKDKPTPAVQAEKPLDEKRKNALLRYLAIMFIVAFLLVLSSLVTKLRSNEAVISQLNQSSTSALQNAESLQTHNRELEKNNAYLTGRIEELEKQLEDLKQGLELDLAVSQEKEETLKAQLEEQTKLISDKQTFINELHLAYELLIRAAEDPSILPDLQEYAHYYDTYAYQFYENLTEKGEE